MSPLIWVPLAVAGFAAVGYGLHRAATWAERRGWIYYRTEGRPPAPWLGTLEAIYKPEIEHVIEESAGEAARADREESGAGGEPGTEPAG